MYSYVGNDPVNRVDPDGQFWGALFRFVAGLFTNLKPNVITGSFTYKNTPPISVAFTPNFQNIGVGFAGIGFNLRSGGHWLPAVIGFGESLDPQNISPEHRAANRAADLLRNNDDCSNFMVELMSIAADRATRPFNAPPTPDFRPILGPNGLEPSYGADTGLHLYNIALAAGRVTASGRSGRRGDYTTYGITTGFSIIAWNREFYGLGVDDQALMTLHEVTPPVSELYRFCHRGGCAHLNDSQPQQCRNAWHL